MCGGCWDDATKNCLHCWVFTHYGEEVVVELNKHRDQCQWGVDQTW